MFELSQRAAAAALVTAALCAGAQAQDETAGPKVDPKADAIVKKMVEHYHNLSQVSCDIDLAMSMSMGEANQKMDAATAFAAERPNKFAMRLKEGMMGITIISDGEHLYTFVPMMGNYTKDDAPADFSGLMEDASMAANMTGAGEGQLLLGLLAENGYENLMTGVTELAYVGEDTVDEKPATHLKLYRDEIDMDLWVADGDEPWIVKLVPDVQKAMRAAAGDDENSPYANMTVSVNVSFENWSTNELSNDAFAFNPPESANEVESLFEMPEDMEGPESALVGQPAPEFTLELLGSDQKIALANHKDKDIVVLDFWATWCQPCVKALPTLDEVTKKFADRNVVFYAVDLQEEDKKVQDFLKQRGWAFNVLMDRDGSVASLYKVNGIPQTVIISRSGVVEAVHVGLLPNLREQLTEELETLIADGKLDRGHEDHDHEDHEGHDHDGHSHE